jgi:hypothetical protein
LLGLKGCALGRIIARTVKTATDLLLTHDVRLGWQSVSYPDLFHVSVFTQIN